MLQEENRVRSRGIYLLPNLFTTAALFAGFYAIVAAMKGDFDQAAVAIFVALIMDGLDGRVARLTHTQSAFGAEYDSLSDMAAFGVAPALVAYHWCLMYLGKPGWLLAFFYTATTALRLARFNTQVNSLDKRYFQGLPCPAAAAVVASLVWVVHGLELIDVDSLRHIVAYQVFFGGVLFVTGSLMVSRIRYYSFKELNIQSRVSFISIFVLVLLFMAVSLSPSKMLTLLFISYLLSGPVVTVWIMRRTRHRRREQHQSLGGKPG